MLNDSKCHGIYIRISLSNCTGCIDKVENRGRQRQEKVIALSTVIKGMSLKIYVRSDTLKIQEWTFR